MKRNIVLLKNILIYSIGNFSSKFLIFLLIPLYTTYLSTVEYGDYDVIQTVSFFLIPIITLQISDGMYRYLLESDSEQKRKQVINISLKILMATLAISLIIMITVFQFIHINDAYYIMLFFLSEAAFQVILQIPRGLRDNLTYAKAGILSTILLLVLNIVTLKYMSLGISALLISKVAANVITILYIFVKFRIEKYISLFNNDIELSRKIIKYSIPLISNVLSWWVMNMSSRFLIIYFLGRDANGVFAIANRFPSIIVMINSIFYLAWQESAITEFNSSDKNIFYTKMFNAYLKMQFSASIVLIAFSPLMYDIVVKNDFKNGLVYLPPLYLGAIFSAFSTFYGTGYQSSKETKGAFTTSVIGAIVNIVTNIILIPLVGIMGAAIGALIAFVTMWIARVIQTRSYFSIKIEKKAFIQLIVISSIFIFLYYIDNQYIRIFSMILSLIVALYYNWDFVILGTKMIKSFKAKRKSA